MPEDQDSATGSSSQANYLDGSKPLIPTAVPTYDQTWQEDSCVRDCCGVQFPADSPTVTWWNGLETVLPFSAARAGISESLVCIHYVFRQLSLIFNAKDEDVLAVHYMVKHGKDATACPADGSVAPVLVLSLPDPEDQLAVTQFVDKMRLALAQGRPVLVPNWHGDPTEPKTDWSKESLHREFYNLRREVIWQGMQVIPYARQYILMYNVLRCPSSCEGEGNYPEFITP